MPDLKPCPFCGGDDADVYIGDHNGAPVWVVDCPKCEMVGPPVDEKEGKASAIEAWNRRAAGVTVDLHNTHGLPPDLFG